MVDSANNNTPKVKIPGKDRPGREELVSKGKGRPHPRPPHAQAGQQPEVRPRPPPPPPPPRQADPGSTRPVAVLSPAHQRGSGVVVAADDGDGDDARGKRRIGRGRRNKSKRGKGAATFLGDDDDEDEKVDDGGGLIKLGDMSKQEAGSTSARSIRVLLLGEGEGGDGDGGGGGSSSRARSGKAGGGNDDEEEVDEVDTWPSEDTKFSSPKKQKTEEGGGGGGGGEDARLAGRSPSIDSRIMQRWGQLAQLAVSRARAQQPNPSGAEGGGDGPLAGGFLDGDAGRGYGSAPETEGFGTIVGDSNDNEPPENEVESGNTDEGHDSLAIAEESGTSGRGKELDALPGIEGAGAGRKERRRRRSWIMIATGDGGEDGKDSLPSARKLSEKISVTLPPVGVGSIYGEEEDGEGEEWRVFREEEDAHERAMREITGSEIMARREASIRAIDDNLYDSVSRIELFGGHDYPPYRVDDVSDTQPRPQPGVRRRVDDEARERGRVLEFERLQKEGREEQLSRLWAIGSGRMRGKVEREEWERVLVEDIRCKEFRRELYILEKRCETLDPTLCMMPTY